MILQTLPIRICGKHSVIALLTKDENDKYLHTFEFKMFVCIILYIGTDSQTPTNCNMGSITLFNITKLFSD